jgi:large subunit ribosomal protein L9
MRYTSPPAGDTGKYGPSPTSADFRALGVATIRRARKVRSVRDLGHAKELKRLLEALLPSSRCAPVTPVGFRSLTVADIVEAVAAAGGPTVDKRRIELSSPIKTLDSHTVKVRLHPEVSANVEVDIDSLGLH